MSALVALAACSSSQSATTNRTGLTLGPPDSVDVVDAAASAVMTDTSGPTAGDGGVSSSSVPRSLRLDEIGSILFGEGAEASSAIAACPTGESTPRSSTSAPVDARVHCLLDRRYRADPKAAELAHELYTRWKTVAGVDAAFTMDGGYRGMIRIEPALPIGAERKHIEWIVLAMRDFDQFFTELDQHAAAPPTFHFPPRAIRFMRSVAARTPSAYANDWAIAWNLSGSLHTSADAVRETLFHEIFHLNDEVHPLAAAPATGAWSLRALEATYRAIVKKCGTRAACLAPYTPNDTMVRGGTYYSFQPGNDVREYAAELALRYYREQRASLRSLPRAKPFKCGPSENAAAWTMMRDEFFGGIDVVPPCGS